MRSRPLLIVSLSMLAGAMFLSTGLTDDSIYDAANKKMKVKGTVTKMTKDAVTITDAAGDKEIKVSEISRIRFENEPQDLDRARIHYNEGKYTQAIELLSTMQTTPDHSEFAPADVDFYLAMSTLKFAFSQGHDKKPAEDMLLKFPTTHKSNYHFYTVAEALGDLAVSNNKYTDALKYYKALAGSSFPELAMRGQVAEGRVLLAQEDFPAAAAKFAAVIANTSNTAEAREQKDLAAIGNAVCSAAGGDANGGIAALQKIIAENDDVKNPRLFARAYNALGNCHLRAGSKKEALLAFLQTHTLFFADSESHAEALYRLGGLYDEMKSTDRANEMKGTLKDRYPGSPWNSRK